MTPWMPRQDFSREYGTQHRRLDRLIEEGKVETRGQRYHRLYRWAGEPERRPEPPIDPTARTLSALLEDGGVEWGRRSLGLLRDLAELIQLRIDNEKARLTRNDPPLMSVMDLARLARTCTGWIERAIQGAAARSADVASGKLGLPDDDGDGLQ